MKTLIKYILRLIATAAILLFSTKVLEGIVVEDFVVALTVIFILGIYNSVIRPIVGLLTIPINFITFGLFSFVMNILVLYAIGYLVQGFEVTNFVSALILSIILAFVNSFLDILLK